MARVKVTINKKGYIPSLGQGPIRRPILITESLYKQLLALGYPVKVISSPVNPIIRKEETPVVPPITSDTTVDEEVTETSTESVDTDESPVVDEDVTEDVVDESSEENEETTDSEDASEEVLEDDPDLSAEAIYTEEFLTSKNLCKKILSNREIQYDKNASWSLLKQLVLDSNPKVAE